MAEPRHVLDAFAAQVIAEDARLAEEESGDDLLARWEVRLGVPLPDVDIPFPIPEDRGTATLSDLGATEYVSDLLRPGRILVVAAEEGTGKSFAISGELAIRIAVAAGSFAGTWAVLETAPVLVLSEMHPDDDYERESTILASLHLEREALRGRLYRLSLMTAAGGTPALASDHWLAWIGDWIRRKGIHLFVVDTATAASLVDPWGKEIQAVYGRLRGLATSCPALAIVLVVHLRKPQGKGGRQLSDVLGEWGRWGDVVLILERDGGRTKLSTRKRVRHERRITATKRDGLLVDPIDLEQGNGRKVSSAAVLAAIANRPGMTYGELGRELGVSKDSASRYVGELAGEVDAVPTGPRGTMRIYATAAPPQGAAGTGYGDDASDKPGLRDGTAASPHASLDAAVPPAAVGSDEDG